MIKIYHISAEFGTNPSDGDGAHAFRVANIDPYVTLCESIELDFTGVRIANSSFINALISGLFEQQGASMLKKLSFRGCLPTIRVLIQAAVDLGMLKHEERFAAK